MEAQDRADALLEVFSISRRCIKHPPEKKNSNSTAVYSHKVLGKHQQSALKLILGYENQ